MAIADFGRVPDYRGRQQRSDRREAALLFAVAYPFCLAYATGKRLSGGRPTSGFEKRKSVFGEAKATASSFVPFAFR